MQKIFRFKNFLALLIVAVIVNGYFLPIAKACYEGIPVCTGCAPDGPDPDSFKEIVAGATGVAFDISFAFVGDTATTATHTITFAGGATVTAATLTGISSTSGESTAGLTIGHTTTIVTVSFTGGNTSGSTFYGVHILFDAPAATGLVTVTNHLITNEVNPYPPPSFFDETDSTSIDITPSNGLPTITPPSQTQTFGHSHAGGTTIRDFPLSIDDGDAGATQTTTLTLSSCAPGFSITGLTFGTNTFSSNLRYLQPNDGTSGTKTCTVTATDDGSPVAFSTGTYTVTLTNAPLTVTNDCQTVSITSGVNVPTTLGNLTANNITGPTLLVSGVGFHPNDADDTTAYTFSEVQPVTGVAISGPVTAGGTTGTGTTADFTITKATFVPGVYRATFDEALHSGPQISDCQIGPSGGRHALNENDPRDENEKANICASNACVSARDRMAQLQQQIDDLLKNIFFYPLNNSEAAGAGPVFAAPGMYAFRSLGERVQATVVFFQKMNAIFQEISTLRDANSQCFNISCPATPCYPCQIDSKILVSLREHQSTLKQQQLYNKVKLDDHRFWEEGDSQSSLEQQRSVLEQQLKEVEANIVRENNLAGDLFFECNISARAAKTNICPVPGVGNVYDQGGNPKDRPTESQPSCDECAHFYMAAKMIYWNYYQPYAQAMLAKYPRPTDTLTAAYKKDAAKGGSILKLINTFVKQYNDCVESHHSPATCPKEKAFLPKPTLCDDICPKFAEGFRSLEKNVCSEQDGNESDTQRQITDLQRQIRQLQQTNATTKGQLARLVAAIQQSSTQLAAMEKAGRDTSALDDALARAGSMQRDMEQKVQANEKSLQELQKALDALQQHKTLAELQKFYDGERSEMQFCNQPTVCKNGDLYSTINFDQLCPKVQPGEAGGGGQGGGGQGEGGGGEAGGLPQGGQPSAPPAGGESGGGGTDTGTHPAGPQPAPTKPPAPPLPPPTDAENTAAGGGTSPRPVAPTTVPGAQTPSAPQPQDFAGQVCGKPYLQAMRDSQVRQGLSVADLDKMISVQGDRIVPDICSDTAVQCRAGYYARKKVLEQALGSFPFGPLSAAQDSQRESLQNSLDQLDHHIAQYCPTGSLSCGQLQQYHDQLVDQKTNAQVNQTMLGYELEGIDSELSARSCSDQTQTADLGVPIPPPTTIPGGPFAPVNQPPTPPEPVPLTGTCTGATKQFFDDYSRLVQKANVAGARLSMKARLDISRFQRDNSGMLDFLRSSSQVCGAVPALSLPCSNACSENSESVTRLRSLIEQFNNPPPALSTGSQRLSFQNTIKQTIQRYLDDQANAPDLNRYFACGDALKSIANISPAGTTDPLINQCSQIVTLSFPAGVSFTPQTVTRSEIRADEKGTPTRVTVTTDANGEETVYRTQDANNIIVEHSDGRKEQITKSGPNNKGQSTRIHEIHDPDGSLIQQDTETYQGKLQDAQPGDTDITPAAGSTLVRHTTTNISPGDQVQETTVNNPGQADESTVIRQLGPKQPDGSRTVISQYKSDCEPCANIDPQVMQGYQRWQSLYGMMQRGELKVQTADGEKTVASRDDINKRVADLAQKLDDTKNPDHASLVNQMQQLAKEADLSYRVAENLLNDFEKWKRDLDTLPGGSQALQNIIECHKRVKANLCEAPYRLGNDPKSIFGDDIPLESLNKHDFLALYQGTSNGPGGYTSTGLSRRWVEFAHEAGSRASSAVQNVTVEPSASGGQTITVVEDKTTTTTVENADGSVDHITVVERGQYDEMTSTTTDLRKGTVETTTTTSHGLYNGAVRTETVLKIPGQEPVTTYSHTQHHDGSFEEEKHNTSGELVSTRTATTAGIDDIHVVEKDAEGNMTGEYTQTPPDENGTQLRYARSNVPCARVLDSYASTIAKRLAPLAAEAQKRITARNIQGYSNDPGHWQNLEISEDPEYGPYYQEGERLTAALDQYVQILTQLESSTDDSNLTGLLSRLDKLFTDNKHFEHFPPLEQIVSEVEAARQTACPKNTYQTKSGSVSLARGVVSQQGNTETFIELNSQGHLASEGLTLTAPTQAQLSITLNQLQPAGTKVPCSMAVGLQRMASLLKSPDLGDDVKTLLQQQLPLVPQALAYLGQIVGERQPAALKIYVQQYLNFLAGHPQLLGLLQSLFKDEIDANQCSLFVVSNSTFGNQEVMVDISQAGGDLSTRACIDFTKNPELLARALLAYRNSLLKVVTAELADRVFSELFDHLQQTGAATAEQIGLVKMKFQEMIQNPSAGAAGAATLAK